MRFRLTQAIFILFLCVALASAQLVEKHAGSGKNGTKKGGSDDDFIHDGNDAPFGSVRFWFFLCLSVGLTCMAGLMSGLTLGLMSLDTVEVEVLIRSGSPREQKFAAGILPLIKRQHLLLVTLLVCNAVAAEALPICLDRLLHPAVSLIISVTVVLFFGEIIPQAVCSRYGLEVGYRTRRFVRLLIFLTYPISYPVGKLLDYVLGKEHQIVHRRAQLKTLMTLHLDREGLGGDLTAGELNVISGALDLAAKAADQGMTPLDKVFMLSSDERLDSGTLQRIVESGYSRIPVHRPGCRQDILGLIISKELITVDPREAKPVSDLVMRSVPRMWASTPMSDMLDLFQTGRSHMAVLVEQDTRGGGGESVFPEDHGAALAAAIRAVEAAEAAMGNGGGNPRAPGRTQYDARSTRSGRSTRTARDRRALSMPAPKDYETSAEGAAVAKELRALLEARVIGIITLEDVIEELLGEEIVDETDAFVDNDQTQRVSAAATQAALPPRLRDMVARGVFQVRKGPLAREGLAAQYAYHSREATPRSDENSRANTPRLISGPSSIFLSGGGGSGSGGAGPSGAGAGAGPGPHYPPAYASESDSRGRRVGGPGVGARGRGAAGSAASGDGARRGTTGHVVVDVAEAAGAEPVAAEEDGYSSAADSVRRKQRSVSLILSKNLAAAPPPPADGTQGLPSPHRAAATRASGFPPTSPKPNTSGSGALTPPRSDRPSNSGGLPPPGPQGSGASGSGLREPLLGPNGRD